MNSLKIEITSEQFEQIDDPNRKMNIIYNALLVQQQHCRIECEKRFKKLENRKKFDTGLAGTAGAIFGFIGGWIKTKLGG